MPTYKSLKGAEVRLFTKIQLEISSPCFLRGLFCKGDIFQIRSLLSKFIAMFLFSPIVFL